MPSATGKLQGDKRLIKVSGLCSGFPETSRTVYSDYVDFRVRKKPFAYFLSNHNNDGIVSVCCRSELGENVDRASREPGRYYLPRYIGKRGWFGIRLDRGAIDWSEVENSLLLSYCLAAPRVLVKTVQAGR